MKFDCFLAALIGLILVCTTSSTRADVLHVPSEYPTIQLGVNAASKGDTVLVACGTYTWSGEGPAAGGGLVRMKSGVTLRSETGKPDCVTVDAEFSGRVMHFEDVDSTARVEGFTLVNGLHFIGAGMRIRDSSPRITDCNLIGNRAENPLSDASFQAGGGAYCDGSSAVAFRNCTFAFNRATSEGGAIYSGQGSPEIVDCVFSNNASEHGGAVEIHGPASPLIMGCTFSGNSAFRAGAMSCVYASPSIIGCTFFHNTAVLDGGAILCGSSSPVIKDVTISDNSADRRGAGLFFSGASTPILETTIIAFSLDGEAIACDGGVPLLICSDVYGNQDGDWVGCIADQLGKNGNFFEDPLFCGAQNPGDPYTLHSDSPCAPENNPECGLVGSRPAACGPAADVGEGVGGLPSLPLSRNAPNPFYPSTWISYSIPDEARTPHVLLRIYDAMGRAVHTLVNAPQAPGQYRVKWNGSNDAGEPVVTGVYFYELRLNRRSESRRMLLLR